MNGPRSSESVQKGAHSRTRLRIGRFEWTSAVDLDWRNKTAIMIIIEHARGGQNRKFVHLWHVIASVLVSCLLLNLIQPGTVTVGAFLKSRS